MVCRIDDVGIVEFSHGFELLQNATNLLVDVFAAGKLPANFVADGDLITALPDPADGYLITQAGVTMVKGVLGQPVEGQLRGFRVCRGQ